MAKRFRKALAHAAGHFSVHNGLAAHRGNYCRSIGSVYLFNLVTGARLSGVTRMPGVWG
jgi:hypothetical protein